jgi:hypothetical protein
LATDRLPLAARGSLAGSRPTSNQPANLVDSPSRVLVAARIEVALPVGKTEEEALGS